MMEKVILSIGISVLSVCAFAQGTVNFNNVPSQLSYTNNIPSGGGRGPTAAGAPGTFYYGLFIAPVGQTIGSVPDPRDLVR